MAFCYRHPDRETGLSCSVCERPICTECMTMAPVGIRCPEHSGKPQGVQRVSAGARRFSFEGTGALVTKSLIGLNVLVFLANLAQGASLSRNAGELYRDGGLTALGTFDGATYEERALTFESGDVFVFFTDGLVDARMGGDEYGIKRTAGNWMEVVEDQNVDIVWIGTHPSMHREITIAALEAGKHVFTQARMAMDYADAKLMWEAAQKYPDKFCILGHFDLKSPDRERIVANWRKRPGMLGFRYTFNEPEQKSWWTDGSLDWFWKAAEKAGLVVGLMATGPNIPVLGKIAERHTGLKMHIDHIGRGGGRADKQDEAAYANLGEMLALARLPGGAATSSTAPSTTSKSLYGTEPGGGSAPTSAARGWPSAGPSRTNR